MVVSPQPSTEGDSPSQRVVRVVADAADVDPLELPPLQYTIDTEALDTTVENIDDGSVQFHYAGQYVVVNGDGTVEVSQESSVNLSRPEPALDD